MEKTEGTPRFITGFEIAILIAVSALSYLPFLFRLGYYFDDWYLMFAAGARGAEVFRDIFSIDRPGRALVMMPLYSLFGGNPLYYSLSAYGIRVIGAVGLLAVLRSLWNREREVTFGAALLFLVYPGFLSQPNAIDYQSHLAGLAAAWWSIACTLKAVLSRGRLRQIAYFVPSIFLGLFSLSQIEWYIGIEGIRWVCVFILALREGGTFRKGITRSILRAYPVLIVPLLFLAWRLLLFQSERGATDVGLQLGGLRTAPVQVMGLWLISLVQDLVDVVLLAWVSPLSRYAFALETDYKLMGFGLGMLAVILALAGLTRPSESAVSNQPTGSEWKREALWLGIAVLIFGLLPVTLANREVSFPSFSRYTLVSSAGAVLIILFALYEWTHAKLRLFLFSTFVLFSTLTHYGNGFEHARWSDEYREFWWQVTWRIPQIAPNTTLITRYPASGTEEDYFIWGPANLIYSPRSAHEHRIQPSIVAAILNQDTMIRVLQRKGQDFNERRSIATFPNYRNILVLSQPSPDSCVRVIAGTQVELSAADPPIVMMIASFSESERALVDGPLQIPPQIPFGAEPPHNWCYFYQQADLARQRGEWETVAALGSEAQAKNLAPADAIEWMPFLQAYAMTNDVDRLKELAPLVVSDPFVALQACRNFGEQSGISSEVLDLMDTLYCLE